jgi:hypothetical protein
MNEISLIHKMHVKKRPNEQAFLASAKDLWTRGADTRRREPVDSCQRREVGERKGALIHTFQSTFSSGTRARETRLWEGYTGMRLKECTPSLKSADAIAWDCLTDWHLKINHTKKKVYSGEVHPQDSKYTWCTPILSGVAIEAAREIESACVSVCGTGSFTRPKYGAA